MPQTRAVVHADTVEIFPHISTILLRSSVENAAVAATELVNTLQRQALTDPYANIGD